MITKELRLCKRCNRTLPTNCFTKDIYSNDELYHVCKECRRVYRKELLVKRKSELPPNPRHFKTLPKELKECMKCHWALPLSEFGLTKKGSPKLRAVCKQCRTKHHRKDWLNGNARWNAIMKKFGVSKEQYAEMLTSQNSKCAICEVPQIEVRKQFAIDHCHVTDKNRGLLCEKCNHLLGQANDRVQILINAIEYLERHN